MKEKNKHNPEKERRKSILEKIDNMIYVTEKKNSMI